MTKIKVTSTTQYNRTHTLMQCNVNYTLVRIGGRCMPIAIYNLLSSTKRYSELKRLIPAITGKMIIQHSKELEVHNLILRKLLPLVPPVVEYRLTDVVKALNPVHDAMVTWAEHNRVAALAKLHGMPQEQLQ